MSQKRVIVCGSRTWTNAELIKEVLSELPSRFNVLPSDIVILYGAAKGADTLAAQEADWLHFDLWKFPANWETEGKLAGYKRNDRMLAEHPDLVIAFWDGRSRGTNHMILISKKAGVPVEVHEDASMRLGEVK